MTTDRDRLNREIANCMAEASSVQEAAELLEKRVRADRGLRDALTDEHLARLSLQEVSHFNRMRVTAPAWRSGIPVTTRVALPSPAAPKSSAVAVTKQALINARRAAAFSTALLSFTVLPGGKILKNSSYAEVLDAASFYGKQGRTMLHKERWLTAVAQRMDQTKEVGASVDERTLRKLQEDTLEVEHV